jgi:hypothetical protein
VSRNNDVAGYWGTGVLCLLAKQYVTRQIEIIVIGESQSSEARPPAIQAIATTYMTLFRNILSKAGADPSWVKKATILVEFGTSGALPEPPLNTRDDPFVCTMRIVDDRDRAWSVAKTRRCGPHDPNRGVRSTRAEGI